MTTKNGIASPREFAAAYLDSGLSTIPIKADETKSPAIGSWKQYQKRLPTEAELSRCFQSDNVGVANIHGAVSGGSEAIDLDDGSLLDAFCDEVRRLSPGLIAKLTIIETPRPGNHLVYRCEEIEGNQVLARTADGKTLIETRGQGGYTLAPGSPGACHETGRTYEHYSGPQLTSLATITAQERAVLFRVAYSFNECENEKQSDKTSSQQRDGLSPGDDYNQRIEWEDILLPHCWEVSHRRSGKTFWRRPGKSKGWSATTGIKSQRGTDLFCCFSSNAAPLQGANGRSPCTSYSKFAAYTELNHDSDYSAAAKALASDGYGQKVAKNKTQRRKTLAVQRVEAYQTFPTDTLPDPVADYVRAAAKAIGCDPSFIALPLLASLGRAIGNTRVVRLKNNWTEPPVMWGCVIGKSGTHKTPAIQAPRKFLDRHQNRAITEYAAALLEYERAKSQYDRDIAAWKRKAKSDDQPPWKPEEPVCTRFTTSDCTIEALAALLAKQDDGLLVIRDELAGWLGGIAEYKGGQGSDLGHWLASWSAQPLTVDRKTGAVKMIHIPRAAVSLVGGIQPGVLRAAIGREHMQDGLCARILLAMPDPKPVRWTEDIVGADTEQKMSAVFDKLLSLDPAANEDGEPEPFPLDLTAETKAMWVEYYNRHRAEQVDLDDDLSAAWSKLEAYTARFALIFQLCTWAAGDAATGSAIDEASMRDAIELSDWFGHEAKRVYGLFAETEEDSEQRELVDWIRKRGGRVGVRELQTCLRRYRPTGEAEAAMERLLRARLVRQEVIETSRRPRVEYVLAEQSSLGAPT